MKINYKEKLKKSVLAGKTSMYGRPRTKEEIINYKKKIVYLHR